VTCYWQLVEDLSLLVGAGVLHRPVVLALGQAVTLHFIYHSL